MHGLPTPTRWLFNFMLGLLILGVVALCAKAQEPTDKYKELDRRGLIMLVDNYRFRLEQATEKLAKLQNEYEGLLESTAVHLRALSDRDETISKLQARLGDRGETSDYRPDGAFQFEYNTPIIINDRIIDSVDFTQSRCNITLKNRTGKSANVDVQVIVMNADGVMLWVGGESWFIDMLGDEQKYIVSKSMSLTMPEYLRESIYADGFDLQPRWVLATDHSRN